MKNTNRRFVFTDYENLLKVKFRKLEKVCDRLFIFISSDQDSIPFPLVRQVQKLGKAVKWITVHPTEEEDAHFNYPLAFVMGRIHQKVALEVEFAVLSNDRSLDTLVSYINDKGRDCLRIQRKKHSSLDKQSEEPPLVIDELGSNGSAVATAHPDSGEEPLIEGDYNGESLIQSTAKETVRRLVHSGNRPAEVETLKRYIQLYNQELTEYDDNVDLIIRRMEANKEIEIEKGVVKYNF